MKISEMTTDQAMDTLCEITPHISDIITDEDLVNEIKKKLKKEEGTTRVDVIRFAVEKITNIVPIILKKKKFSVYAIIAAVNQTDIDTVKHQNIIKTMIQIREIAKDDDLVDFVKSCLKTEKSA